MTVVLDTCALLWWTMNPGELSSTVSEAIAQMEQEKNGYIASISLWEIALKIKKQKLFLDCTAAEY